MNIAVAQSGGPTCAINASLVGVFRESLKEPAIDAIFGSVNGVEGIIQDHLIDLKTMIRTNEDMELLRQTPSTVLGSCRYKLPDFHEDSSVYEKIAARSVRFSTSAGTIPWTPYRNFPPISRKSIWT